MTHQEDRERLAAERKIANMSTAAIVGYLVVKHRFSLSVALNAALAAYIIVTSL